MMREIKFRGKEKNKDRWVYGYLLHFNSGKMSIRSCNETCTHVFFYSVDPDTVGQYTGLKDKNGVEVYEGDVLRYVNEDREDRATLLTCVAWRNGGFIVYVLNAPEEWQAFDDEAVQVIAQIMEVVTNIHDSPELLNN